jgi:hypothetical protein
MKVCAPELAGRIAAADWAEIGASLDRESHARLPALLEPALCRALRNCYDDPTVNFRSTVHMARHHYGRGEYRYFDYPLPGLVDKLRHTFYPHLAEIANRWRACLGEEARWPCRLEGLIEHCRANGQTRPTPLLLRYGTGDYNCLHRDMYGDVLFPLQVIVLLSEPGSEFDGGELVLTEQRARRQSRPVVVRFNQGDAVIVPVSHRPEPGAHGFRRVHLRHGVSTVRCGHRMTLGLIFHDAA